MHSSHTGEEGGKKLIEERRQLFSGGAGWEKGERKPGNEKDGWQAKVLKRGRQNPGFSLERKKRRGFHQMMD